jgi:hypothetical protein
MKPNNFDMRDWHIEHAEKVIVSYIKGPSFEKRNFKKYSTLSSSAKQIEYDIKHGVTFEEVFAVMNKIRNDESYSEIRQVLEAVERLDELERQLVSPKGISQW